MTPDTRHTHAPPLPLRLYGRRSSHFTRVALIFADELDISYEFVPIHDMAATDPEVYGGNPALKMPTLRRGDSAVFGAANICRALADLADLPPPILWPEDLRSDLARSADEMVWHGMAAQVQLVGGVHLARLPADSPYFIKARRGFEGALTWLDAHLPQILPQLPPRHLSLLEVALYCLIDHIAFRRTLPLAPYPTLRQFAQTFAERPSAARTAHRFDPPPT